MEKDILHITHLTLIPYNLTDDVQFSAKHIYSVVYWGLGDA